MFRFLCILESYSFRIDVGFPFVIYVITEFIEQMRSCFRLLRDQISIHFSIALSVRPLESVTTAFVLLRSICLGARNSRRSGFGLRAVLCFNVEV